MFKKFKVIIIYKTWKNLYLMSFVEKLSDLCRNNNCLGAIQPCSVLFLLIWVHSFDLALLRKSHLCCILGNYIYHGHPFTIRFFDHHCFQYYLLSSSCWKWQKLETEKPIRSFPSFHFARMGLCSAVHKRVYFSGQWNSHHLVVHLAHTWRAVVLKAHGLCGTSGQNCK